MLGGLDCNDRLPELRNRLVVCVHPCTSRSSLNNPRGLLFPCKCSSERSGWVHHGPPPRGSGQIASSHPPCFMVMEGPARPLLTCVGLRDD